jgi:hypothetical protein
MTASLALFLFLLDNKTFLTFGGVYYNFLTSNEFYVAFIILISYGIYLLDFD